MAGVALTSGQPSGGGGFAWHALGTEQPSKPENRGRRDLDGIDHVADPDVVAGTPAHAAT
jgi:hypothetical protein